MIVYPKPCLHDSGCTQSISRQVDSQTAGPCGTANYTPPGEVHLDVIVEQGPDGVRDRNALFLRLQSGEVAAVAW